MAEREYKIPSSEREHFSNPPVLVKKTKIRVHVPEELEDAKGPHVYDSRRTADGTVMGYQAISYDRGDPANDYPKMLYHPKWGEKAQPDISKFVRAGMSPADYESAVALFQEAMNKWGRGNRTRLAKNEEHEKELLAKGWLVNPPQHKKKTETFDLDSDEI